MDDTQNNTINWLCTGFTQSTLIFHWCMLIVINTNAEKKSKFIIKNKIKCYQENQIPYYVMFKPDIKTSYV